MPVRLPSTLLERRPDIAAAERTMKQENALIGVAFAGYYPDVTLTGAVGYLSMSGLGPTNQSAWSYGLSAAQTLFDAGLTAAQVEAARATYTASVATYRQTVLTAFQQVEDQLAAIPILTREATVQVDAVKAAEQAVQIALNEYQAGTQNFTTVVTARGDGADGRGIPAVDARAAGARRREPDRRARRRLGRRNCRRNRRGAPSAGS